MKTSTKILLVIFIVFTVPAIFLGKYLLNAISPTDYGFNFNFDTYAYVALGFVIVSSIFGSILYFRFISNLRLSKAIFFSVFPVTIIYAFGLYSLAIVGRYTTPIANSVKIVLNIAATNNYNSVLWAVLLTGVYLLYIFFRDKRDNRLMRHLSHSCKLW